jgi:hypothetical protein
MQLLHRSGKLAILFVVAILVVGLVLSSMLRADSSAPRASQLTLTLSTDDPHQWARYPAANFRSPAGDLCDFPLKSKVVFDKVYVRTTARFATGDPRRQEFSGPLTVRLTNQDTGFSVIRYLSAYAIARYQRDKGYTFAFYGPVAVGLRSGDTLPAATTFSKATIRSASSPREPALSPWTEAARRTYATPSPITRQTPSPTRRAHQRADYRPSPSRSGFDTVDGRSTEGLQHDSQDPRHPRTDGSPPGCPDTRRPQR